MLYVRLFLLPPPACTLMKSLGFVMVQVQVFSHTHAPTSGTKVLGHTAYVPWRWVIGCCKAPISKPPFGSRPTFYVPLEVNNPMQRSSTRGRKKRLAPYIGGHGITARTQTSVDHSFSHVAGSINAVAVVNANTSIADKLSTFGLSSVFHAISTGAAGANVDKYYELLKTIQADSAAATAAPALLPGQGPSFHRSRPQSPVPPAPLDLDEGIARASALLADVHCLDSTVPKTIGAYPANEVERFQDLAFVSRFVEDLYLYRRKVRASAINRLRRIFNKIPRRDRGFLDQHNIPRRFHDLSCQELGQLVTNFAAFWDPVSSQPVLFSKWKESPAFRLSSRPTSVPTPSGPLVSAFASFAQSRSAAASTPPAPTPSVPVDQPAPVDTQVPNTTDPSSVPTRMDETA
ncbi:hypothetical protein BC829DRAFT_418561 [Chytridium lagenaria]|nr:hypothetical protein BC829DRAFT_418561 [Chytridium lagenaria]